eukprot:XP_011434774.1 PREDICTED: uncharacterized protein LOC105333473 [Crassostrea gigas]
MAEMRSFEDFGADGVTRWLKERDVSEDVQDLIAENDIDGRTFLDLNESDLKDLSSFFKVRKEIRRCLEELHEKDKDVDESDSPQFKRKRSPSPPTGNLPKLQRPAKRHEPMRQSLQMDDYFIPRSEILNNPSQHSQQSIETERRLLKGNDYQNQKTLI